MTPKELDERIARKLGWERVSYTSIEPEKWPPVSTSWEWPPVSTSWEWAGRAMEEVHKRLNLTHTISLIGRGDGKWDGGYGYAFVIRDLPTGPLAIAHAVDAVLSLYGEELQP